VKRKKKIATAIYILTISYTGLGAFLPTSWQSSVYFRS